MKSFLEHVAQDILQKYGNDLADIAVVFPNKRAALFLNQQLAQLTDKPMWSPAYITISELFRQHSTLTVADSLKCVADLHKSFVAMTGKQETLDQFLGWGQLLLADFDDIDKNDADAEKVFRNLKDFHEYDDISYLTTEQKELLKRFFSNFQDDNSTLQRRFIEIWSHLYDIYQDFRQRLKAQGLAYEGMLYREVAKAPVIDFTHKKYLFVGFNVLQSVERQLFHRLHEEGKAAFYWDYDHYYVNASAAYERKTQHEAGVYIRRYLEEFPNELDNQNEEIYDNFKQQKDISFLCAPTENIQARFIAKWLQEKGRIDAGNRTAIVLCNEGLLQTVIHCIPPEVESMNVTTGYPLQQTAVASLVTLLLSLQLNGYDTRRNSFRTRFLQAVLRHPYLSGQTEEEKNEFEKTIKELQKTPSQLLTWLKDIIRKIATNSTPSPSSNSSDSSNSSPSTSPLQDESLFRMYTLLNRLQELIESGDLAIDNNTLQRLIKQLISATSIPFHGEPAVGIQVMGVLETRNLDFDHVLILSCNEGNMPKGVDDSSFIPHSIRSAYGLTTIDNKVAIYSYYFHRLLQRAQDVTILYNNATEGSHTGEMSRFMLQLLVEYPHPIQRLTLRAGQIPSHHQPEPVIKDQLVAQKLDAMHKLSPTAINRYMRCPLQFYYCYVAELKEKNDMDDEKFDSRMFGNVFHRAAQLIYDQLLPHDRITKKDIEKLLQPQNKQIDQVIEQAISEELFGLKETTTHPPLNGLQLISREVVETYLRRLLRTDMLLAPFRVIGHEHDEYIDISLKDRTLSVGGRIDRLDALSDYQLRIVDYKTGNKQAKDIKDVSEIFESKNIKSKHTDYILQSFLYSIIIAKKKPHCAVAPALLFVQHTGLEDYDPILTLAGEPVTNIMQQCGEEFLSMLTEKIQEIFDLSVPFEPTSDSNMCSLCPYHDMCRR